MEKRSMRPKEMEKTFGRRRCSSVLNATDRYGKQKLERPSSSAVMWDMPIRPTVFSRIMRMAWSGPCGPPSGHSRKMRAALLRRLGEQHRITPSPSGHSGKPRPKNLNGTPRWFRKLLQTTQGG